ncbi:N-acetylmuramoyl-L-alanine amidase [Aquitalea palustris]|uniref:N-acetylmuramoyl-L-alanine amidase n=1 Tax=Aquitalea palustris TaxID=2480983 RepID=A0A454JK13_9NEIS|nr:N-acetylmuramoyl-L-alanine amidase [Aquitalea palustris]RMC99581.1 N-acetylmuramoyl-L-alanine amidase [Aquitalea palustris]
MSRTINLIVIHCAASPNGKVLGSASKSAAAVIDQWHAQRGFHRQPAAIAAYNPDLKAIGYHFVLDVDGSKSTGRALDEIGAHVAGHNANSIGICMVGTDQYSTAQWGALTSLVKSLLAKYPGVPVVGHRDRSPDLNGDGTIEPSEWTKTCPGFTVADWLAAGMKPQAKNVLAS